MVKGMAENKIAEKASKDMVEVVAALIQQNGKFLICRRPAQKKCPLLWEFVGGKVEAGETRKQALLRECREELAIDVAIGEVFAKVVHTYPDATVHLTVFHAVITKGVPQKLEHEELRWVTVQEIPQYQFCPADVEILQQLRQHFGE